MSFLSPLFLAGLPLLSIPVVIHLLSRRQQKRISWGAMRFLIQAATRKRRIWRLTDLLLLLLRITALLCLTLALARPLLPVTWLGGAVPRELILILDQSLSLSQIAGGHSLFQLQLQKADALLDELTDHDSVRVLLAGEAPHWLRLDPVPANTGALRQLREDLANLKPTLGSADLIGSIRESADLEPLQGKSARVIYLITDGQRAGWHLDESPLWAAVSSRIDQSGVPTSVHLQLLDAGRTDQNLAVNSVDTPRAFAATGQTLPLTATIQNHGTGPTPPTLLEWRVNDQSIGVATVPDLRPGAATTLTTTHAFDTTGTIHVVCRLESGDPLPADNEASLLIQVFEQLPILIAEDPGEPLERDTSFLLAALGIRPNDPNPRAWRSVFEPTTINTSELAGTDLARFECVILANVSTIEPAALLQLEQYVRQGGGVWIALGPNTDETAFNDHFHNGGLGLSPLKLNSPIGDLSDRETYTSLRATFDAHPATALLADFQRLDLDRVRVYRRHQFDPFSGKDVSVLLQAPGGEPVVVERKLGRGRVLVQGIPLGPSWSTLPLCQVFVAMLHEWCWYLSEPSLTQRNLAVGELLLEPAPNPDATAQLTLPDNRILELTPALSAERSWFRLDDTRLPGLYTLTPSDGAGAVTQFHVRRTPSESNLAPLTTEDRQHLADLPHFALNDTLDSLNTAATLEIPLRPLEGWLLAALALVVLGELALAGWTTHQRNLRPQPITM